MQTLEKGGIPVICFGVIANKTLAIDIQGSTVYSIFIKFSREDLPKQEAGEDTFPPDPLAKGSHG